MKLNNENIDEIMFQLLEGEIQGEERNRLIEAIQADKIYNEQWMAWQRTVLNPNDEFIVMDTGKLIKNIKRPITFWLKYSVAAIIIMSLALGIYYFGNDRRHEISGSGNGKRPLNRIIRVPSIESGNQSGSTNDSAISFKQKVNLMVDRPVKAPVVKMPLKPNHPGTTVNQGQLVNQSPDNNRLPESYINHEHESQLINENTQSGTNMVASGNDFIMTIYTENELPETPPSLFQKIEEKRSFLSRAFSRPKLRIINDTNNIRNKKILLENKEYRIIAGF